MGSEILEAVIMQRVIVFQELQKKKDLKKKTIRYNFEPISPRSLYFLDLFWMVTEIPRGKMSGLKDDAIDDEWKEWTEFKICPKLFAFTLY